MKAVICGAGIAGLALAHRLAPAGWDVTVVEKAPGPRTQGYMIDFFGPGYTAAEALGVLPRMAELSYRIAEAAFVDERGRRRAAIDYRRFEKAVGSRMFSIMRPDLEQALREQLPDHVELRFGTGPAALSDVPGTAGVTLTDGTAIEADLVVGADGIHSTVRELAFGPERQFLRPLGFHTAAFAFTDPDLHARVGDGFRLTDTVGRQMGFYGLRGGRVAAFAVHRTGSAELPADHRAALRSAYGSLGWIVPRALELCPPHEEVYYDLVAQSETPAWSRGRTVLLGDACSAVSLLAGQGASLAIAGAAVLGRQLDRAATVEEALTAYERSWRPVVAARQRTARDGAAWFLPETPARLRLRRTMLHLARIPGIDRRVATALIGKDLSVPMD